MKDNIPKSAPLTDKEKLVKPLEVSSNSSSEGNMNNNNIFNENNKNQNLFDENFIFQDFQKNYSSKIIQPTHKSNKKKLISQNINVGINVNIIEGVIPEKNKKKKGHLEPPQLPKSSPYNFKYFCNTANKKSINQALSDKKNLKPENKVLESNFIKLSKEANIYTSNAEYIKNKKMLIFDKYDFENNKYKPNRAKLFDMTAIPKSKNQTNNILYKTTKFRGGRMFFFDNKNAPKILESLNKEDLSNKNNSKKKPLYLRDLEKYEIKKKEKMNKRQKPIKYIDNAFQKHKRYPPSNSLYKELMNKKNEIYDNFMLKIGSSQDNIEEYVPSPITFPSGVIEEEKIKKPKNENLNGFSILKSKKKNDGIIPITFPLVCTNMINCDSISEKARYENIMEAFIKLKCLIENDQKYGQFNERRYITEFIYDKNIDKNMLTEENFENFKNFLKLEKMPIDINKSLKDNIIRALNYKSDKSFDNQNNILDNNDKEINYIKPDATLIKKRLDYNKPKIIITESNIFNNKPLENDIPRQKRLLSENNYKNDLELRDSLLKELEIIEDEVENKQGYINQIENNLNLLPFETDYYYKYNLKLKQNKKENKKDLRLISQKEFYKTNIEQNRNKRKTNNKYNLYDFNERLYYTWYKNKNIGDIKNYQNKNKLTEYIIYNRTKEKIMDEKIKEIAEKKRLKMKKVIMTP